ncbi:hypothetical protein NQ317_010410 [Molorchus minor]|uniref:RNase H type-1 domain-containing protein n=1 Tax=Molorchus minor TaxID=1323400 RepID=A0ABQ9JHJ8_9CUCU|nr:hypothetical protein NQ317_010410 [Molorchus minor]
MTACKEKARSCSKPKIFICSNSKAALQTICASRPKSAPNQECRDALEQLARSKDGLVLKVWVPRYIGVPGNEKADEQARSGYMGPYQGPEPFLGITKRYINNALNSLGDKTLENKSKRSSRCRQANDLMPEPSKTDTPCLLGRSWRSLK